MVLFFSLTPFPLTSFCVALLGPDSLPHPFGLLTPPHEVWSLTRHTTLPLDLLFTIATLVPSRPPS